jgi:glycosyltransferase involved in cell wall biosynthesis
MRLNIVLHDFSRDEPFGGLKAQYEFANRLAERGHDVAVYHSVNWRGAAFISPRSWVGLLRFNARGSEAVKWFELSRSVRCVFLPRIWARMLRRTDATVLSSFLASERIPQATERTGRLLEFVYELPVWRFGGPTLQRRLLRALQRDDVTYIASSAAVEAMLNEAGSVAVARIQCALDPPEMAMVPATTEREAIVGFAMRPEAYKGTAEILAAVPMIRAAHPGVVFECFGRPMSGSRIPDGIAVHGYLTDSELAEFYRRCSVFVSASRAEGWGLTVAEAMANGAAVVVTDNGGSGDFATDGETAVVVDSYAPEAISTAVSALLADLCLRRRLAEAGVVRCQRMTWDAAVDGLLGLLA